MMIRIKKILFIKSSGGSKCFMNENYVNVSEFARRAGVSRQTVYNKIKDGTLQYIEVEGRKLLSVKDVKKVVDTLDSSFDSSVDTLTHLEEVLDTSFDTLDDDDKEFFNGFDSHIDSSLDTSVNQLDTLQVDSSETFDSSKSNLDKAQMTFQEVFGEEFRQEKDSESSDICQKSNESDNAAADSDSVTVALLRDAISVLQAQIETQKAQLELSQDQHRALEAQLAMKDAQINDLSQRLQEAHTIADHSQHLYAAAELRLKAITDQSTQEHPETAEDGQKHWWQFWK